MILQADKISFRYGTEPFLENISLSCSSGEVTMLLGGNGSGKTTLLRLLSGGLKPQLGDVRLEKNLLSELSKKNLARALTSIEQHIEVPFEYTVEELVALGRIPHIDFLGRLKKQDNEAIQQAMDFTSVSGFKERSFHELSSGEKQRVWLALALAQETQVILLDEPLSHLDIKHQLRCLQLLQNLAREGKIIIISIHDITLAERFADKVMLLKEGQQLAFGPPKEVLNPQRLETMFGVKFQYVVDEQHQRHLLPVP